MTWERQDRMSKTVEQVMADEMRCGIEELGDERCIMPGWLAKASIIRLGDRDVVLAVDREELARIVEGVIVGDYRKNARTKADESVDAILQKLAEGGLREVEEIRKLAVPADTYEISVPILIRHERVLTHELKGGDRYCEFAILKPLPQAKEVEGE